jgi:hypothetical protein
MLLEERLRRYPCGARGAKEHVTKKVTVPVLGAVHRRLIRLLELFLPEDTHRCGSEVVTINIRTTRSDAGTQKRKMHEHR